MSGINTGILTKAYPLSTKQIKELEKQVLENQETFAYLDENSELCFSMPHGVNGIKDLAWNNAYELSIEESTLIKKAYKKNGLRSFYLDRVLQKQNIEDSWSDEEHLEDSGESEPYAAGLYQTGAIDLYKEQGAEAIQDMMVMPWDELVTNGIVSVNDGVVSAKTDSEWTDGWEESERLTGDLMLPTDGSVTSIGDDAFCEKTSLTAVFIPKSVISLGYRAFCNCVGLTSAVIGKGVTSISDSAFEYCSSLTSIVIPDSVTSIGNNAFYYCTSLTSIVIPDSVMSIGYVAFEECSSLENVVIGSSVTSIDWEAFCGCHNLKSIVIPDSVTSIGDAAFRYCENLASAVIGNGVTSIGESVFGSCCGLTSIVIPDNVTSIGVSAFLDCYNLTSVVIGNNVTSISRDAFYNCFSLESVVIPASVTSIGAAAFEDCTSLTSIVFDGTVEQWNAISLENGYWDCSNVPATYVQCSDGQVAL